MLALTARWVLPITSSPIHNGEVVVESSGISYCGPMRPQAARASDCPLLDLGDSIIMPGLVNTHTHLEYTVLRGFLEDIAFFPWIRALMVAKEGYQRDDWIVSARLGALECIESGITTIGDNTDAGVTAQVAAECGLRARLYQEVFGIDPRDAVDPALAELDKKIQANARYISGRIELGVSPHALYTVRPDLMRRVAAYCAANTLRTSIHIAESVAEAALCARGAGPFAEMFAKRGIAWAVPGCSPTRAASDLGALGPGTLAVHCVHQDEADIALLAASGAALAHCAKSNAKLGAGLAPLTAQLEHPLLASRIGLGTDSAVSNNTHDLFEEMRFALLAQRAAHSDINLSARRMVEAATIGGAAALGWEARIGSIEAGKCADLIAVKLDNNHACPSSDPYAALVYSCRADDVCWTMVNGRILYEAGRHADADAARVRKQARDLRAKIPATHQC